MQQDPFQLSFQRQRFHDISVSISISFSLLFYHLDIEQCDLPNTAKRGLTADIRQVERVERIWTLMIIR